MSIKQFKDYLESKLFNGYVREPIPSVLIACFVGCAFLFIAISATVDICFSVDEKVIMKMDPITFWYQTVVRYSLCQLNLWRIILC